MSRRLAVLVVGAVAPGAMAQGPAMLEEFREIDANGWLRLAVLLLGSMALAWVVRYLIRGAFRLLVRLGHAEADKATTRGLRRSLGLLAACGLWWIVLPELDLPLMATAHLLSAVNVVAWVGSTWFAIAIWDGLCDRLAERASQHDKRAEKLLIPVTRKFVRAILLIAGVLLVVNAFGRDVTGALAGLGIGGLVLALAAKDSVENVFGSLTILFDMPFALGDWVKVNDIEGVVEVINLRSTRIRTFEDSLVTLPNSNLIKASVENFGARRVRRQRLSVRLAFENDPDRIQAFVNGLQTFLGGLELVQDGRSTVQLTEASETSLGVLVQCFFETNDLDEEMRLRGMLMMRIVELAKETGVVFATTHLVASKGTDRSA